MGNANANPQVIGFCADQKLLENLRESNKLLEQVTFQYFVCLYWQFFLI